MKDFLVDIGSNRRVAAGMLLAETSARARAFGAGEVSLSSNSELWCLFEKVRTHFAENPN